MRKIVEIDWNFDKVPDKELVACCYWEYARESAFIRKLRERCIQNWHTGGYRDERLSVDLGKLHNCGPRIEVLMRGFYFAPGDPHRIDMQRDAAVTNSFPAPWQTLAANEREFRVRVALSAGWYPAKPFERADWNDVKEIAEKAEAQWKKVSTEYKRMQRENPGASEVDLRARGKLQPFNGIHVSILREDGKEVTAVAINWARFNNEQIVSYFRKWAKSSRPKEIPSPSDRGHKPGDWRAKLTRLAVMRLLSQFSALQIVKHDSYPAIWKTKQFSGRKWSDFTKWRNARREAAKIFHMLFPVLPQEEKPLSWKRQAPAK